MRGALFVDTSAWVGLFAENDQYHERAVRVYEDCLRDGRDLVTTNRVLAETVTRIRREAGHKAAATAWDVLEQKEAIRLIDTGPSIRRAARRIFGKYSELEHSLVDCVSFAIMIRLGLREAFTFDSDFEKAGFMVRPGRGRE